ncbi:MAG: response regulator [Paludibacter sp.]|nr:response regulator [Paludibacter sp.]
MIDHDLKNAKILIVDDLESNIDVLKGLLEMEGYTNVEATTDPRKVLGLVKSFDPELLLLDLMMPRLNGFEVMEQLKEARLKSLSPNKFLPIMVLTADITSEAKHKALAGGAKDFLSKPFDLIEVSYRIKNLLETQFLYQQLKSRNMFLEDKIVKFLKIQDDWYK